MGSCGPTDGTGEPLDPASTPTDGCHGRTADGLAVIEACVEEAEALFASGTHHCAEAVVSVIREHFRPEMPEEVVRLVSGLGGGCGIGCICGALSGATIALGLVLQADRDGVERMTRSVHQWFKATYGTSCCRALQNKQQPGCRVHPGDVAGKVAELLLGSGKAGGS
jgi:C_GCAxxG_C_C family probable redox protein